LFYLPSCCALFVDLTIPIAAQIQFINDGWEAQKKIFGNLKYFRKLHLSKNAQDLWEVF